MRTFIVLVLTLGSACQVLAKGLVFENDAVRFTLGSDGLNTGLVEKSSGKDWLSEKPSRFAWIRKAGRVYPATNIQRRGPLLRIAFGTSGVTAVYKITDSWRHYTWPWTAPFRWRPTWRC